ncbi:MAG: PspA/IM30 family protein [Candidatus Melainabacteria bacterium]|nr:PspA/IM30 family protein [Candidatus Melainabacteria bacterium]
MFERVKMVFRAMINALLGKVENPQSMLEHVYQELQSKLIATRKEYAQAIATEMQLKHQLESLEKKETADAQAVLDLKEQLTQLQARVLQLWIKLDNLETEVQKAYTKKQLLIVRNMAMGPLTVHDEVKRDRMFATILFIAGIFFVFNLWASLI